MYNESCEPVNLKYAGMEVMAEHHTCVTCMFCVVTFQEEVALCYEESNCTSRDYVREKHMPALCVDHNRDGKCAKWKAKKKKPFWSFLV